MTDYIAQLIVRYPVLSVCEKNIRGVYMILESCYANGGKLLVAGNGGSCADADHICAELLKSFVKKRPLEQSFLNALANIDSDAGTYIGDALQGGLPAISLGNHTALITAMLNDVDENAIYAQQVNALGAQGDVFLGISTSGNAPNVAYAAIVAKAKGLKTVALSGKTGGKLATFADEAIVVPENETYKIQELHVPVYHALCLQLEQRFF